MRASVRISFLFVMIVMSGVLTAPAGPQDQNAYRPLPPPPPDVEKIRTRLLGLLNLEPAFQGVGTELTSAPGVTTYRIYVNRWLLRQEPIKDELPESIKALLADPAGSLQLPVPSTVVFKPVLMDPLRTFAARMGGSTSTKAGCSEGTVGVRVMDEASGATGFVTNNHVAGAEGPLLCPNAKRARQVAPGMKATMCHAGPTVGTLQRGPKIEFDQPNRVDAAFVKAENVGCDAECPIRPTGTAYTLAQTASLVTQQVQKWRPETGLKNGTIVSIDAVVRLIFLPCGLTARFEHQIEIEGDLVAEKPFAVSGDSGAWVFDTSGKAVGMIFAGDEVKTTFVNPADAVLSSLGVKIVPCP